MVVTASRAVTRATRVASVDVIRGVVMVLMAIDHVRVYSGVPAGGPTAGVFFTRWVTHFCAPVFVFLAGTSVFLMRAGSGDTTHRRPEAGQVSRASMGQLSSYLLTRGLLLVILEPTLIRAAWTFGFDYSQFILAGVIWMLGVCMMLMAGLVWLPLRGIAAFGFVVVFGQDLFQALPAGAVSQFIYFGGQLALRDEGPVINILYSIVPWIGVMALGYAFGSVLRREPQSRDRACLLIGLSAIAVFVLLAAVGAFSGQSGEETRPALFRMLDQRKYPASQLFLLMTLGPAIAMMPFADRARGRLVRLFDTFGRVPMFYYLLHIPVIHAFSLVAWRIRDGAFNDARFATAPYVSIPPGQRWDLWLLYVVFVLSVAALYPMCRWYAEYKARTRAAWTRYI